MERLVEIWYHISLVISPYSWSIFTPSTPITNSAAYVVWVAIELAVIAHSSPILYVLFLPSFFDLSAKHYSPLRVRLDQDGNTKMDPPTFATGVINTLSLSFPIFLVVSWIAKYVEHESISLRITFTGACAFYVATAMLEPHVEVVRTAILGFREIDRAVRSYKDNAIIWLVLTLISSLSRIGALVGHTLFDLIKFTTMSLLWLSAIPIELLRPVSRSRQTSARAPTVRNPSAYFRYEDLQPQEFRLLKLSRKTPWGRVRCELEHFAVAQSPPYEAISYTWGNALKEHEITLNDRRFVVSAVVQDILKYRRSFWRTRHLWIDSICINQLCLEERSQQVRMMRNIYRGASHVLAWLGTRKDAHHAVSLLNILPMYWIASRKDQNTGIQEHYMNNWTSRRWLAFTALLQNPWFTRIWVVQEVVNAKTVYCVYGGYKFPWMALAEVAKAVQPLARRYLNPTLPATEFSAIRPLPAGIYNASVMQLLREDLELGDSRSLISLLLIFSNFKATEARDIVFALQGLCSDTLDPETVANYSRSPRDVYVATARYLLSQPDGMLVLPWSGCGYDDKMPGLPSWVPDWSCNRGFPHGDFLYFNAETYYNACLGLGPPDIKSKYDTESLVVKGVIADKILVLGERLHSPGSVPNVQLADIRRTAQDTYRVHDEAWKMAQDWLPNPYRHSESLSEAFWRTLIGDRSPNQRPAPLGYRDYYETWKLNRPSEEEDEPDEVKQHTPEETKEALARAQAHLESVKMAQVFGEATSFYRRRFAVTQQGRMGIVPEGAEAGDLICIIAGGLSPYTLREARTEEHTSGSSAVRAFLLIGESYVHGIMDGEAVVNATVVDFELV